jgi:hypothetical protein
LQGTGNAWRHDPTISRLIKLTLKLICANISLLVLLCQILTADTLIASLFLQAAKIALVTA